MIRRVLPLLTCVACVLRDAALFLRDVVLASACARVAIMAIRLWPKTAPLAVMLGVVLTALLWSAAATGHNVFLLLAPASPTGILAALAGLVAAVAVAELSALALLAVITALLQLAADSGRHRVHALLGMAAALALVSALPPFLAPGALTETASVSALLVATGLLLLTLWFGRTYRLAGHRRFRDFHLDVTEARLHLAGSPHDR